jgi:G:T/U-mismatch repair DNA glycosylase
MELENHPFEPFLPSEAKVLFLGTFPAKPIRWSMNFYYPNFTNDFWRIMGMIFYSDKSYFEIRSGSSSALKGNNAKPTFPQNRWNEEAIREFCSSHGFAFSDTAEIIHRLKGTASDADLQILKARDIPSHVEQLPKCQAIVATGTLASEVVSQQFGCKIPKVGESSEIILPQSGRRINFFRLPSTSRAYPLTLEKKADFYRKMLLSLD